jgi:hypothetical protein
MKLLPVSTICRFLGKKPEDGYQLIDSGMPVARIPGDRKNTPRVVPSAFVRWMEGRLGGVARAEDIEHDLREFIAEIDANDGRVNRAVKSKGGGAP